MRRAASLIVFLFVTFVLVAPAVASDERRFETLTIAEGTRFATAAHVQETGRPGPTVVIVAGLHGDEPASAYAAGQIRHWPLRRGRLVVVPRANVPAMRAGKRLTPGAAEGRGNANRNFPRADEKRDASTRGELAAALWALLRHERPDWVLDLHEGYDVHKRNPKSVGRTVIAAPDARSDVVVARMLGAVNATITDPALHFARLTRPVDGSVARAASEHLGARTMIVETATRGLARSTRAMQHRVLVHRFLTELKMVADGVDAADVGFREGVRAETLVGVFDGGGATGAGVPSLLAQLPVSDGVAVARIGPTEIVAGALERFDVVVFPGGMAGTQARYLGEPGRANVRLFVDRGGGYVGICAGAYLACSGFSWGLGILDARTKSPEWKRGTGTVEIELTEQGRGVLVDREDGFGVRYANGPILAPDDVDGVPDYETLAVYRTEVAHNGTPKGIMIGSPAIVRGTYGAGRVVCFGPHPEQTRGLHDLVRRAVEWCAGRGALSEEADAPVRGGR